MRSLLGTWLSWDARLPNRRALTNPGTAQSSTLGLMLDSRSSTYTFTSSEVVPWPGLRDSTAGEHKLILTPWLLDPEKLSIFSSRMSL
jgi:hypothetical protein